MASSSRLAPVVGVVSEEEAVLAEAMAAASGAASAAPGVSATVPEVPDVASAPADSATAPEVPAMGPADGSALADLVPATAPVTALGEVLGMGPDGVSDPSGRRAVPDLAEGQAPAAPAPEGREVHGDAGRGAGFADTSMAFGEDSAAGGRT